jgi:ABC-type transport system substrate-binding protein
MVHERLYHTWAVCIIAAFVGVIQPLGEWLTSSVPNLIVFGPHNYPQIIGDLAKSWTVSDDYLTYTFTLHEGVKFHDDSELTAADVKASWDRIVFPPQGNVNLPYIDLAVYIISAWKKIGVEAEHKVEESATWSKTRVNRDVEMDEQKRIQLVKELDKRVLEKVWRIQGLWNTRLEVRAAKMRNYTPQPSHWMNHCFEDVWLAEK